MLNDHDRLVLFLHRLEELKKRRYYDRFGKQITREESDNLLMDDDALAAYMLSFRHFQATGSPIFIDRIHQILVSWSRIAKDEETATQLRDIRANRGGSIVLEVHDMQKRPVREIKEDELFKLYLNGHFFHTDEHALQFFYQLPREALTKAKVAFQFILGKRTSRILAYYPLVLKALASKKLKPGVFTTEILHAGEEPDSPSARTFPLDGI